MQADTTSTDLLHELARLGTSLARHIHDQARAETDPLAPEAAAAAFDRVARAVRRTVLLIARLEDPARRQPARSCSATRIAARKRVIRAVEDAIGREAAGPAAETLRAEFDERLDTPDLDDDLAHRPVGEVINEICQDLGLGAIPGFTTPWQRRTPADLARLQAQAARTPFQAQRQPAPYPAGTISPASTAAGSRLPGGDSGHT